MCSSKELKMAKFQSEAQKDLPLLEGSREIELPSDLLVEGSCDFELPSAPRKLRQIVSNLNLLPKAYVMISMQISCFNEL
jgi:hypothetical protein